MSLMLGVGCAAAPPCPAAEPCTKPPATPVVEAPAEEVLKTTVSAELKGEFAFIPGKSKEQVVDFTALSKSGGAGEVLIGFTAEGVALSAWQLTQKTSDKDPDHTVCSLCRGRVAFQPGWRGKTMVLPFKIEVKGFSDVLDHQVRREGTTTKTTRIGAWSACGFSLGAGEYAFDVVASDAQGPSKLRIANSEANFELDRSTPVTDLDIKTVIEGLKAK